jgi:beta-N-acetylhexosaminidase
LTAAFISGCAGLVLDADEKSFFRESDPWGIILFKRNIDDPDQVRRLTSDFREAIGRADAPVLIDQEGGRVQRMGPPHWPKYPNARTFLGFNDPFRRREMARLGARLMAADLLAVGVTVDCLPVLDVPVSGAHDVIGNRAYAEDPITVAALGRAVMEGMLAGSVLPVMKHAPGHGRAFADSHLMLPVVDAPLAELAAHDFPPFAFLSDCPAAMTAHVVYTAIDPKRPGTVSRRVLQHVIRGRLGFDGLLISDDLSMKALSGSFEQKTRAALGAGCDVVLHCNGVMAEMQAVASAVKPLAGKAAMRAKVALSRITHPPEPFDAVEGRAYFERALASLPAS